MLEFFVIILIIIVALGAVQLRKQGQTLAKLTKSGASEPDALIVALGQIPEGNYQSFVANPEVFAKAHAVGQRIALMENHLTKSLHETLKAAEQERSQEYHKLKNKDPYGASNSGDRADKLEKRAQAMMKNTYLAAPELPATER